LISTQVTARADAACPAFAGRETAPEWWRHACVALHGHRALGAAWYACDRAVKDVEEGGDLDAHLAASLYNSRSVVELDLGLWEDAEASLAKADAHHPDVALYVAALADVVLVRAAGAVLRLADAVANVDPNVGFPDSSEEYEARLDAHGFPRGVLPRARKVREVPNFKGSYLGCFPLVSADFWTTDHLSERSRSVNAVSGTRARGTLTLKRR
jgi:hypothetical protein